MDALRLSAPGKAHELVDAGQLTFGGKFVVNPSGGTLCETAVVVVVVVALLWCCCCFVAV